MNQTMHMNAMLVVGYAEPDLYDHRLLLLSVNDRKRGESQLMILGAVLSAHVQRM